MIERWAMLKDNVVENICLWDGSLSSWQPPEGIVMVKAPDYLGIGWIYSNGAWEPPKLPDINTIDGEIEQV